MTSTYTGADIVERALSRVGQKYILGAKVHLANPNWSGPWDCAEFVSWACYHAYKIVMAVRPPNIQTGESYSGWWHEDAVAAGTIIPVEQAIGTVGAILIRKPGHAGIKIGHVAISCGDGSTVEANSSNIGVDVLPKANKRQWSSGALIPGVSYDALSANITLKPPSGLLQLANPFMRGDKVTALQKALAKAGVDPGPIDGVFGVATATAVAAFQAMAGLVVDGVVGDQTRKALGL